MAQGTVIKCMAIYPEPFWRAEGLTGQATSDIGPVRVTFDNSPPDGAPGVLLGFLEGRSGAGAGPRGPRRSAATPWSGCFTRLFGPRAASPDGYVERVWADEEWTRGCYGCAMPTGAWTEFGPALRAPDRPAALGRGRNRDRMEWVYGRSRLSPASVRRRTSSPRSAPDFGRMPVPSSNSPEEASHQS